MATYAMPLYNTNNSFFPNAGMDGAGLHQNQSYIYDIDYASQISDEQQDAFQSFMQGGLAVPTSNVMFTASQQAMAAADYASAKPHLPCRPALSASSDSVPSTASSMHGSPAPCDQFANQQSAMQAFDVNAAMSFDSATLMDPSMLLSSIPQSDDFLGANTLHLHSSMPQSLPQINLQMSSLSPVGNPVPHFFPQRGAHPLSPALSIGSNHGPNRTGTQHTKSSRGNSPYAQTAPWGSFSQPAGIRRTSSNSLGHSSPNSVQHEMEETEREKNRCPFPECGRFFKDLKAHMLTHQNERPEKCPIPSCEYNKKGFSRKYDKNRHTLTHYKGTMVCGFCPGSGSAAEKSFNRADVFKRHLTSVHGVEQNPPNSRKKAAAPNGKPSNAAADATGKCSICNGYFSTPQNFYEHLEDCVLSVVQNIEPSEAINEKLLGGVAEDDAVKQTLERNRLPDSLESSSFHQTMNDDDDDEAGSDSNDDTKDNANVLHVGNGISNDDDQKRKRAGLTWSKGGVALHRQGRKRRKHYPNSWGASIDKMKMKKRVLTVWDGPRRLAKDDMMLGTEYEVRMPLPDTDAYVTDLDVQTMKRAEGFYQATDDERGSNMWTNYPSGVDFPTDFSLDDVDTYAK